MSLSLSQRLADVAPDLEKLLTHGRLPPAKFAVSAIECRTVWVPMRDGTRLATEIYLPPTRQAPVIVVRTPYDRNSEERGFVAALMFFARRGFIAVSQDCRGTGDSEPDSWDYYIYESNDGYDCVDWITRQEWFGGFIGSFGNSYAGQTQWPMAMHPAMSAVVPGFSGLGIAANTAHLYMFLNAYSHSVGKGEEKVAVHVTEMERLYEQETMTGGYFNEPLHTPLAEALVTRFPNLRGMAPSGARRWLWLQYCAMSSSQRAEFVKQALGVSAVTSVAVEHLPAVFGQQVSHDALSVPHASSADLCRSILAPPLLRTGWYDWCLNDALATWEALRRDALPEVAERARLIITPFAHHAPGYHENVEIHPELMRSPGILDYVGILLRWYESVRDGETASWPRVIYYLMGANEWRAASEWPPPHSQQTNFYLGDGGALTNHPPQGPANVDRYTYDPDDPTPTVGGSIVSYVYPPGSVDVSLVQQRSDVLVYTTSPLEGDLDVVGALKLILYASSSAVDTDFVARLTDVFPDGRAIQLQSGILRTRYRDLPADPELLEPERVYCFEIDLWATANCFKAGHRICLDLSSADFPHFDRNSNRGGEPGEPVVARQAVYHDPERPSHLRVGVLPRAGLSG